MTSVQRKSVVVDGLRLSYLEAGTGRPVLLLHGWPTNAELYRHALPAIGENRRAIALDLPGFGASDKPLDRSYSFRFFDQLLTDVLAALGVETLGLVVHDLGGPIGLHWAVSNADRITDLVLLNTVVFPEMSFAVKAFVASTKLPLLRDLISSPRGVAWAMRFGVSDESRIDAEVAKIYTDPYGDRASRKALLKAGGSLHPKGFTTIERGLGALSMPLRILYGEEDRILPNVAKTMARVQALLPHAELTAIPDCGHFLQEDRPEEVADLLAEFLGRGAPPHWAGAARQRGAQGGPPPTEVWPANTKGCGV
ncbi:MAG: alpha/beta fold hydrolase, partial [Myxococcota bacterium]